MDSLQPAKPLLTLEQRECCLENEREIDQRHLINKLNFLNFSEGTILVAFRHRRYDKTLSFPARPLPCTGERLDCLWVKTDSVRQALNDYVFQNFLLPDGKKVLSVHPRVLDLNVQGVSFILPQTCRETSSRKVKRHHCEGISIQLIQNSALFQGHLIDFSPYSLRVQLSTSPPQTFQWINPDAPASMVIANGNGTVYTGSCRILSHSGHQQVRSFILQPELAAISRFRPKEYRSARQQLVPSPYALFRHPIIGRNIDLEIVEISGSGFAVEEKEDQATLLPGLLIPDLQIRFSDGVRIPCKAQVIHRKTIDGDPRDRRILFGLAILDMPIEDHIKLQGLLQHARDPHAHVCNHVDLDALWKFFFDTGFIYPKKYLFIQANKEQFKQTYHKLYTGHPNFARHFIYQDKGSILGHMSMLRFYQNSWMIHHLAASKSESNRGGVMVLRQISHYANDIHHLYSAHMDFAFGYFRPENRFPERVFGGVIRHINNPKAGSLDTFAYFRFQRPLEHSWQMPAPWSLTKAQPADLVELENYYEHSSGGLMIPALDLEPARAESEELAREYEELGIQRERNLFALKKGEQLKAIIILNISDPGLNLADLTNCFKIIVVDGEDFFRGELELALTLLSVRYDRENTPVLLHPVDFAKNRGLAIDKFYNLWILNLQHLDAYFRFLEKLLRRM